ncbi:predicted protein [Histoplasma capsulatum G186AR]|uniref:Uncharacterized protein n=1 Tax=Ajellomyces capsulatus (strain G186AR / H82 / ATCC MYA-2454 / RMSCC 2432) TaxID=447093 RepID=C0NST5_AJECG|nr:uncharacterized protein HCBG_06215 [Histoplasma capsulatum G186AR]EEH05951.1 predicted protein [Histoplasma capsulatum G186AR]
MDSQVAWNVRRTGKDVTGWSSSTSNCCGTSPLISISAATTDREIGKPTSPSHHYLKDWGKNAEFKCMLASDWSVTVDLSRYSLFFTLLTFQPVTKLLQTGT